MNEYFGFRDRRNRALRTWGSQSNPTYEISFLLKHGPKRYGTDRVVIIFSFRHVPRLQRWIMRFVMGSRAISHSTFAIQYACPDHPTGASFKNRFDWGYFVPIGNP